MEEKLVTPCGRAEMLVHQVPCEEAIRLSKSRNLTADESTQLLAIERYCEEEMDRDPNSDSIQTQVLIMLLAEVTSNRGNKAEAEVLKEQARSGCNRHYFGGSAGFFELMNI